METTINQRIEVIIKHFKYRSIRAFADKIGIAQTSLNDIIKKNAEPKHGTIEKILKAEPLISPEWLITGQGSMLKSGFSSNFVPNGINANYNGTFSEPVGVIVGGGHIGTGNTSDKMGSINEDFGELINENIRLQIENERLKMNIALKDEIIKSKDDMIQNKIEIIKTKDEMINFLSKK